MKQRPIYFILLSTLKNWVFRKAELTRLVHCINEFAKAALSVLQYGAHNSDTNIYDIESKSSGFREFFIGL